MASKSISLGDVSDAVAVDYEAVCALVQAFDGVCKVGVFYPPGHVLCDQAAEEYLRAMIRVIGPAAGLTITIERNTFYVQGVALDAEQSAATRMRDLLDSLGIIRVDLHRDLTANDLYDFVRALYAHRSRMRNATTFQQLAVDDMPSRVRVSLREFLDRPDEDDGDDEGGGDGESASARMASLLATFTQMGLNAEQQAACRRVLLGIPDRLAQRRAVEGVRPPTSWPDIEIVLRYAVGDRPPPASLATGTAALARMLRSLSAECADADPSEAIDLLVSLSARQTDRQLPASAEPAAPLAVENRPALAPDPLHEFLAGGADPDPAALSLPDRREQLAILMQLQRREQKPAVRTRIERTLRDVIATGLPPEEETVVAEALREMAADGQPCLAATTVLVCAGLAPPRAGQRPRVPVRTCRALRRGPVRRHVALPGQRDPGDRTARRSPALGRGLRAGGERIRRRRAGCPAAAGEPRMPARAAHRRRRVQFAVARAAPDPGLDARNLAGSSRRATGGDIDVGPQGRRVGGRRPASDRPGHARRSGSSWPRGCDHPTRRTRTQSVHQLAAPLLAAGLADLPAGRRREPWVARAIVLLGRCRSPQATDILRHIVAARRILVFPVWPAACRRAAAAAVAEAS